MPNIKPVLALFIFADCEYRRAILLRFWVSVILIENENLSPGECNATHRFHPLCLFMHTVLSGWPMRFSKSAETIIRRFCVAGRGLG
nr:MAG TPA_asm: protein of unknown function (DUF5372) [Caudoviricetes sp.]